MVKHNRNHKMTFDHTKFVKDVRTILLSRYDSSIPISHVSNRRNLAVSMKTGADTSTWGSAFSSSNAVAMKFKVATRWSASEIGGRSR